MRVSRWMAAPVAAAALIAAAGAAFAAAGGTTTSPAAGPAASFWSTVAAKLGVPTSALESAIRSVAQQDRKSGTRVPYMGYMGRHFGRYGAMGVRRAFLMTAASYLGVAPKTLMTDLRNGQSLAQVTTASGKSVTGLEAALSARATKAIDHLVQHSWTPRGGRSGSTSSGSSSAG